MFPSPAFFSSRHLIALPCVLFALVKCNICLAQDHPDCDPDAVFSEYCDNSWKGLGSFYDFLRGFYIVEYKNSLNAQYLESINSQSVHIWINPPDIPLELFQSAIEKGGKFLIFDESSFTEKSFNIWYREPVHSEDSPTDNSLSHINGNHALPILDISPDFRIAMNHPTPLVLKNKDEKVYCYTYSVPPDIQNTPDNGHARIFRDESMVRQLMLYTLDNQKYIKSVLDELCLFNDCKIILYEPGFSFSNQEKSREDNFWNTLFNPEDFFWSQFKALPWRTIWMTVLSLWMILVLCLSIPLKRNKGQ